MKILIVNKFLYPCGGAEKYAFSIGDELSKIGYDVQYFGVFDERNVVSNRWNIYVKNFSKKRIINPLSLIYSYEAKRKMLKLLKLFKPDCVHLNNISYHLTSSIINACKKCNVPVLMTIHDPQLVCPNHRFYIYGKGNCTKCLDLDFRHCYKEKCLKNSFIKSFIAYLESKLTHSSNIYDYLSFFIVPSLFLKDKLIYGGYKKEKCIYMQNYSDAINFSPLSCKKKDYLLYYGRVSEEKGIKFLLDSIPDDIELYIAGEGPLKTLCEAKKNVHYLGFQNGKDLYKLISEARATVYPSIWYENCPLSIIESISLGTPVIGTDLGGIPELIVDGFNGYLFDANSKNDFQNKLLKIMDTKISKELSSNCFLTKFETSKSYIDKLTILYERAVENEKENK